MIIGVPKEVKIEEYRVGAPPKCGCILKSFVFLRRERYETRV